MTKKLKDIDTNTNQMETYTLINKNVKAMRCDLSNYSLVCKELVNEGFKAHVIKDDYRGFQYIEVSTNNSKEIARPCYNNIYIFNYVVITSIENPETKEQLKVSTILQESTFNKLFKKDSHEN